MVVVHARIDDSVAPHLRIGRGLIRGGNTHYELRSGTFAVAAAFDRCAMQFDEILDHRKANAEPPMTSIRGEIALEKYVENVRQDPRP